MASALGRTSEIPSGGMASFNSDGNAIGVARIDGRFYGFSDLCTHLGCSLSSGQLNGTLLRCLCHGSVFDVTTGEVVQGPADAPLTTYAIAVTGEELSIAQPAPSEPTQPDERAIEHAFANCALFAALDADTLETLEALAFRRTFAPGEVIVEEGRTGNGLYVILEGRVEVIKALGSPSERVLATLRAGEPFGELALLGDWKRTASVRAVDSVSCAGLDRWVFLAQLRRDPELAIRMLQYIAQRLVDTDAMLDR